MTKRQTNRSRAVRRAAVVLAAAIGVTTVASSAGNAATSGSGPVRGGTLNVATYEVHPGWCFGDNPGNSGLMVSRTIYETLVERTKSGYKPLLAESITPSSDYKTWTVKLRTGIKYHDGSDFNAANVVKNFEMIRGNAFIGGMAAAAGGALTFQQTLGLAAAGTTSQKQAAVASLASWKETAARTLGHTLGTAIPFTANIVEVKASDASTVVFTLENAQRDFQGTLYGSGRFTMRADAQINDITKCSKTAIGTGPFVLDANSKLDSKITVTANPNYWRTDGTNKLPYLNKIVFTNVKSANSRSAGLKRGTYQAGLFSGATDGRFIQDLRKEKAVKEYKSDREFYPQLWLNQGNAGSPFKEQSARDAVAYATNVDQLNKTLLKGEVSTPSSLTGKANVMYSKTGYKAFNLKKAEAAVAAYKTATGKDLEFVLPHDSSQQSENLAKELRRMWQKAGMKVRLEKVETAQFLKKAFNSSTGGNDFNIAYITTLEGADTTFSVPFLSVNAYSQISSTGKNAAIKGIFGASLGGLLGLSHHSQVGVDAAFKAGQASGSKADFQAATKIIQEKTLTVPMGSFAYSFIASTKLANVGKAKLPSGGVRRTVTNFGIDFAGVWLTK
jgi:peptide/nickel transport system substrate-binding protein